ncbi:MAG TPA: methyltransferase domain-containing protein [Polyangiaceae bacterium]
MPKKGSSVLDVPPAVGERQAPVADAAIRSAVEAPDRSPEDRALDGGRKPAELLAFFGIAPGMRVAEIAAGGGYTAELLARVVGSSGKVYGVNSEFILDRFARAPWEERLRKPAMTNVIRLDRNFDDPLPTGVTNLDAVLCVLFYHDLFWMNVDRARMNAAIFRALKPGGVYAIVDHSARAGSGASDVQTLHRVEEQLVQGEITRAGFELVHSAAFLKNPNDTRDWNANPRSAGDQRGTSDRFVLKFVKPG